MNKFPAIIENRHLTAEEWKNLNPQPILLQSDLGFESDTNLFKIGDNVSTWNELNYSCANENEIEEILYSAIGAVFRDPFLLTNKEDEIYVSIKFKYPVKQVSLFYMDLNEEIECEKYEVKEMNQIVAQYNTHHIYRIPTFKAGTEYSVKILTTSDNTNIPQKWKKVGTVYLGHKSQIQATYSDTDDNNTLLDDGYRVIKTFDLNTTDQLTFKFKNAPIFNRGKMFIYSLTQDDIKNKKIYINGIAGGFTYHDDKQMFISNQELIFNDLEITIK